MEVLVVFGSTHNSTKRVVEKLPSYLNFPFDVVNAKNLPNRFSVINYELILFFTPTYGDEELQEDMENFLINFARDFKNKKYAICELGNYYGYDDFSYGAMEIIRGEMTMSGAKQFVSPLSMDSLPKKDWDILEKWCCDLNEKLRENHG